MSDDKKYREGVLYPHNVLEGFQNGCLLDLRVRLAVEIAKSPVCQGMASMWNSPILAADIPPQIAIFALNLAEAITAEAESRGWIQPLPTDTQLDDVVESQAKRTGQFQAAQQHYAQKHMADLQSNNLVRGQVIDINKH